MPKLETCVVFNDKLYCWDEQKQAPSEAEILLKPTTGKIPEEAMDALFLKLCKTRGLIKDPD